MEVATRRRLQEELGIDADLEFVYRFSYQAQFAELGSENELCSVFLGNTNQTYTVNDNEIEEARYVSRDALNSELQLKPEEFTPWFKMEWDRLCGEFAEKLAGFAK